MNNFSEFSEEEITKILTTYKNKRIREINYYNNVLKDKLEFKEKNRERAKKYYHGGGKEHKKNNYVADKEFIKAKSLYNYYLKNSDVKIYKEKYGERYKLLIDRKFIKKEKEEFEEIEDC